MTSHQISSFLIEHKTSSKRQTSRQTSHQTSRQTPDVTPNTRRHARRHAQRLTPDITPNVRRHAQRDSAFTRQTQDVTRCVPGRRAQFPEWAGPWDEWRWRQSLESWRDCGWAGVTWTACPGFLGRPGFDPTALGTGHWSRTRSHDLLEQSETVNVSVGGWNRSEGGY